MVSDRGRSPKRIRGARKGRLDMPVVESHHIVADPAILGGEPRIDGHRIGVSDVAIWIAYQGRTPAEVAECYQLTLGQVYAALSYYYDHKEQVDTAIAEAEGRHHEMAARYPQGWRPADGTPAPWDAG